MNPNHPGICGMHLAAWRITQAWHWATLWRSQWRRFVARGAES
jgi:hypothetical protein